MTVRRLAAGLVLALIAMAGLTISLLDILRLGV